MSRDLTAAVQTAVDAVTVRPAFFVFLDLASGPVRVWSGIGDYTLGGEVFSGVGTLGSISPIEEGKSVSARGISMSLSGIPSEIVSLALSEPYRNRPVAIWLVLFEADGSTLIADEVQIFSGRIDTMTLADSGETSTIALSAESRLIDLERPRELRFTDQEQKRLFPGDRGLEYVAGLQGKDIPWGVRGGASPAQQLMTGLKKTVNAAGNLFF